MNNDRQINITPVGDTLNFREGAAAPIFNYEGFRYTANSTPALIALVKSKGVKENCVISYDEKGFKTILNDQIINRRQDRITYDFQHSLQYEEWQRILEKGCVFDQKNLIDFLKRREDEEIEDVELLISALQNFKFVTNISGDFSFDDRNNYTFAIKVGDAEGTVKLPQIINARIEIFNESGYLQDIEIEVEVQKPKGEGEKPLFSLTCPKLSRYQKAAVDYEIDRVKSELDGYLIVAGNI